MTALSPALDTALAGFSPTVFGAVRIELPNATIALLDGSAVLPFDGHTYVGRDATYGVLGEIENLGDGVGDDAPSVSLTLYPASDAAAADLASPLMQGSPVYIHVGAMNPATGQVIGTHLLMAGEIDVPTLNSRRNSRSLDITIVSSLQRLLGEDEGIRLSPDWHKGVWPGETGLDDVVAVPRPVFWGVEGDNTGITIGGGTGYGGGPGSSFENQWVQMV